MDLLKKRGSILTEGKYEKLEALDKEMKASFEAEDVKQFKRPVSCFITFNT